MKNVKYISASAGSGKTYTLTENLEKVIESGAVAPENVILTTFTEKAANEFKEKAKAKLYSHKKYEEAARLDQAMIGTVHAVANMFIQKYWYVSGNSPKLNIMTDDDVEFYQNQSLANLPTEAELEKLYKFRNTFDIQKKNDVGYGTSPDFEFWKETLSKIVGFAKNYNITADELDNSLQYSKDLVDSLTESGHHIVYNEDNVKEFLEDKKQLLGGNQTREKSLNKLRRNCINASVENFLYLKELSKFIEKLPAKCQTELSNSIASDLYHIWSSEEVRKVLYDYLDLIFSLAKRWMHSFTEYKKQKHLIDFNDMEVMFNDLLDYEEVKEDIKAQNMYLFVDEFQDSSPIQVKIFDKLSELVKESIWVGDYKQAIYKFRGADTELTKAVTDNIGLNENGNQQLPPLTKSYRTLGKIVNTCNATFSKAFSNTFGDDTKKLVELDFNRKEAPGNLRCWPLAGKDDSEKLQKIASNIAVMISDENVLPSEIAVLARRNTTLDELTKYLQQYNIPVHRSDPTAVENHEMLLVTSLLSLILNKHDNLARAQIAFLSQKDFDAGKIFDSKLEYNSIKTDDSPDWLEDNRIIKKLMARRSEYKLQSVSGLVETLIIELDLYNLVKNWPDSDNSAENLQAIIVSAKKYEEHCAQMGFPATIYGFISFTKEIGLKTEGAVDGVNLVTFHKSKGLEWKHVILFNLDEDLLDEKLLIKRSFFGNHARHKECPSATVLYPEMYIGILPFVYTTAARENIPEEIQKPVLESDLFKRVKAEEIEEGKRLLYVAMTRPRDSLILAAAEKDGFTWFNSIGVPAVNVIATAGANDILNIGSEHAFNVEYLRVWKFKRPSKNIIDLVQSPKVYETRDMQPSKTPSDKKVDAKEIYSFGKRITIKAETGEADKIGTCIHDIFAFIEYDRSTEKATEVIKGFGFETKIPNPEEVVEAWNNLEDFLTKTYGKGKTYHELPFKHFYKGQIYTGSIDLIWETEEGVILVDFKTFPGSIAQIMDKTNEKHYVGNYKGQFECYRRALEAAGKKVKAKLVYYAVGGSVVEIK